LTNAKKNVIFFSSGGIGYGIIELIWRGRTHWTMIIAGGVCFVIFSLISEKCKKRSLVFKTSLCALSVTLIEFVFGVIFNIILKMKIWDYSNVRFNLLGQVCLLYSLLWALLSAACLPLADFINRKIKE